MTPTHGKIRKAASARQAAVAQEQEHTLALCPSIYAHTHTNVYQLHVC